LILIYNQNYYFASSLNWLDQVFFCARTVRPGLHLAYTHRRKVE